MTQKRAPVSFSYFTHKFFSTYVIHLSQNHSMSFLRRNLSSYPQPVLVTPDPRESISDAVTDAIESTQTGAHEAASATSCTGDTDSIHEGLQTTDDQHQHSLQNKDNTKIADGLMSLMGPIVQEMDFNIVSVRKSQTELEREIERLLAGRCTILVIVFFICDSCIIDCNYLTLRTL